MKIAIVENEPFQKEYLETLLQTWAQNRRTIVDIVSFQSAESFLGLWNSSYDLVFLDIQLGEMDGVSAAHHLRDAGFQGELIFLTGFSEYVFQGYDVRALNYLLKPPSLAQVEKHLDYVAERLHDKHYTFRYQGAVFQIPFSKILYFSSANHHTKIVTTEQILTQAEPMRQIYSYLPMQFLFCHRTAIINLDHVLMIKGQNVLLSNEEIIPVGPKHLSSIRSALLSFAESMR